MSKNSKRLSAVILAVVMMFSFNCNGFRSNNERLHQRRDRKSSQYLPKELKPESEWT